MKPNFNLAANAADLNDQTRIFPRFDEKAPSMMVLAANDANFDAAHLSEPLTEYIVDTPDAEGLDTLLEAMAPSVPVGRAFAFLVAENKEAFQAAIGDEDIREIGGSFAEQRLTGSQTEGRTDNKGLSMLLDNDQGGEDPAVQQRAVANLRNRLLRSDLYRVNTVLDANDTAASSENWGPSATKPDPDGSVASIVDLGGDARGINSNIVVYGGGAFLKRFRSMGLDTNAARYATRNLTPDQIAEMLGVDKAVKCNFRYQSSATAKTKIIADNIYAYYVRPGATKDDPSNIKRFVTSVPGGGMFRVYIEPILKRTRVTVEHYSRVVCTSTLGIYKLPVTYT